MKRLKTLLALNRVPVPRRPVRVVAVLLAALAVPVAVLAAPLPASAADVSGRLCEANTRNDYCVGAPSIDPFAPVVETPSGRNLILHERTVLFEGFPTYLLEFAADTGKCVAAANNDTDVVVHPCDGHGVVWAKKVVNGQLQWINRAATLDCACGQNKFLAGGNNLSQYQVKNANVRGWDYNFALI